MNKWKGLERVQEIKGEIDGLAPFKGKAEMLSTVKGLRNKLQLYRFDGEERNIRLMVEGAERVLDEARAAYNRKYQKESA